MPFFLSSFVLCCPDGFPDANRMALRMVTPPDDSASSRAPKIVRLRTRSSDKHVLNMVSCIVLEREEGFMMVEGKAVAQSTPHHTTKHVRLEAQR